MDVNVRFQIAATLIYLIILVDYFSNRKLPVLSNRLFSALLFFSGFNLVLDFATVYTITNMKTLPGWINHGTHIFFIGSLNLLVLIMFFYMDKLAKNQKRGMSLWEILFKICPAVGAVLLAGFGNIHYFYNGKIAYSYGPAASSIFLMLLYYMSYVFVNTFRYKKQLNKRKRIAFRMGVLIWAIAGIVQGTHPGILTSNMAQVLMVLFLYLAFENPKEYVDEATSCFNQPALQLMLNERLESRKAFQLINIVIENYQRINASYGYNTCNVFMQHMSEMIGTLFGVRVFHTGGNILTVIIVGDNVQRKESISHALKMLCANLEQPVEVSNSFISVKAHVDVVEGHTYGKSVDGIFGIVNYMAHSNKTESNEVLVHYCDEDVIAQMDRKVKLEFLLQDAIDNDGFDVVYQPILDTKTKSFRSSEALIRLKDRETIGFVSPEEFIPIAEEKGMIMDVGRIVFNKVLTFAKEQELKKLGVDYIEVNLSGIQCADSRLPQQLKTLMEQYHIDPSFINLEITETAMVESDTILLDNMGQLRNAGFSFSMDDFGTGYSNLSKMAAITYDLVKLDKSLIWPCFEEEKNENAEAILNSVVAMLLQMKVHIVAEGVETEAMVKRLTGMGVNYLQGYFYSKPVSETEYIEFLKNKREGK